MYVCLTQLSYGLGIVSNNPLPGQPLYWCAGLYFEEPFSYTGNPQNMDYTKGMVNIISSAWKQKYPGSPVLLGETTKEIIDQLDEYVDNVNSTIYEDYFYYLPPSTDYSAHLPTVPTNDDQRDVWTNCYNTFGSKFNNVWINADADQYEYNQLITHAIDRGISNIWLYNPWGDMNHTNAFCYYAWSHGMLTRWSRRYSYEYTYIGTGNPCTDDDESHWMLTGIYPSQVLSQN